MGHSMNDFHKIANEIAKIPEEEMEKLSLEERLNELVKFRAYLKEYYDSYDESYISFLANMESESDIEERFIME